MSQTTAFSLIGEGCAAARAGDKDEARRLLQEAAELDPDNETVWLWLASVSETPLQAVQCLETVLDINPDNPQARAGIGNARLHAGIAAAKAKNRASARRLLTKVAEEDPECEAAWLWLASVSDSPEEAIAHLQRVLDINPDNDRARKGMDYYVAQTTPAEPVYQCPFCEAEEEPADDHCPACGAAMSLANIEAFFGADGPDPEMIRQAAERLSHAVAAKSSFEGHLHAALAYLNGKRIAEAVPHLRSALALKTGDAAFRSQVRGLLQRHAAEEAAVQKAAAQKKATRSTILCVDDSATIRKLISVTLEEAGYRVVTANNGYEAVDVLRDRGVPNLIIMDINMPEMDGYQLCKLLRQNDSTKAVPILMLSSKDGLFNKLRGQMAGSTEYLTKPFEPDSLVRVVAKYCGG